MGTSGPLSGKVALVTGGAVRVGRALCEALAAAGAKVAVHANGSSPEDTLRAIHSAGGEAQAFQADLCSDTALVHLVERVEESLGPIGILVNSAARFERAAFLQTDTEGLDRQWALNARAPYLLAQEVGPGMVARGEGDILNILDVGGSMVPWQQYSAYCMTKAALGMLTQCLALELAPAVRVNGVAPGTVLPPESLSKEELTVLRERIPMKRFGSPEDVARTAMFLLTGPRFVTGQIIAVDGGRALGSAAASPERRSGERPALGQGS